MLTLSPAVRIYLSSGPTDMRCSIDGLSAVVQRQWPEELFGGHFFVFHGRRRDKVKILCWDRGGFVVYYKRLERGRFQLPEIEDGASTVRLDPAQLVMLLDGIDLRRVRRLRRWQPGEREEAKKTIHKTIEM